LPGQGRALLTASYFVNAGYIFGKEPWNEAIIRSASRPIPHSIAASVAGPDLRAMKVPHLRTLPSQGAQWSLPGRATGGKSSIILMEIFPVQRARDPALLTMGGHHQEAVGGETIFRHLPGASIAGALPGRRPPSS